MGDCAVVLADGTSDVDFELEEECTDLEPFFFDEASAVAEHLVAEEKRRRKEEEDAREKERIRKKIQDHLQALDRIREFDHKRNCFYYSRFHQADLSVLDLDEESPIGPMRYTDTYTKVSANEYGTIYNQGSIWFKPASSANVHSLKIAASSVGFPVNVYGTVVARDSLDNKCVYLFRCDRDHSQHITSADESLTLIGPKRGLLLQGHIYFEMDLKIKGDQGQADQQFSKGLSHLDGTRRRGWEKMVVERDYLDTKLSTVEVTFAAVKRAVEATIAIEVLHGEFNGKIAAETTSFRDSNIVLYNSEVVGVSLTNGVSRKGNNIQLWRPVIAVCVEDDLILNFVEVSGGDGKSERANKSVSFKAAVKGRTEIEVPCGSCTVLVKIAWSIIARG